MKSLKFAIAASSQLVRFSGQFLKQAQHLGRSGKAYLVLFLLGVILPASIAACSAASGLESKRCQAQPSFLLSDKCLTTKSSLNLLKSGRKRHNQNVIFERSYGGSLAQTEDIIAGKQEADVVHLSLPLDVVRIEEAGLINFGWEDRVPRRAVVTHSAAQLSP